jgi:hypothetical protein
MHAVLDKYKMSAVTYASCSIFGDLLDFALLNSAAGIFPVFEIKISAGQDSQGRVVIKISKCDQALFG